MRINTTYLNFLYEFVAKFIKKIHLTFFYILVNIIEDNF